jgi:hypothetical protein
LELEPGLKRYAVAGGSGATAAVINDVIGALWNPHATKSITVVSVTVSKLAGAAGQRIRAVTARGTPGSTITPDVDNDFDRLAAPASGAVLDLGPYSVQPTVAGPADWMRIMPSVGTAVGTIQEFYFPRGGLWIEAGSGMGLAQTGATSAQFDISFVWDE